MKKLQNRVAIITGAASGIGEAAAKLFADEGASIVVADVNAEDGKRVVDEIKSSGGQAHFSQVDVTSEAEIEAMIQAAVSTFGRLDILYNNAGYEDIEYAHKLEESSWDKQVDINLKGTFLACKHALRHFSATKTRGVILNTASIAAFLPTPMRPAYNAAKGGVVMLTKNIAAEYGPQKIRANAICPGITLTGMTDGLENMPVHLERAKKAAALECVASPDDIARPALFLCSDDASFITGTTLQVDGGMNLCQYWRYD